VENCPRYRVVGAELKSNPGDDLQGHCDPDKKVIRLKKGMSGDLLRRALLHEMCHIGSVSHGKRFRAKLERLVSMAEARAL
jgi:predicted metal-dependent hydrolase